MGNTEGVGQRVERGAVRLTVVGRLGDPDDEGSVVGTGYLRGGRARPDVDLDAQYPVAGGRITGGLTPGSGHERRPVISAVWSRLHRSEEDRRHPTFPPAAGHEEGGGAKEPVRCDRVA